LLNEVKGKDGVLGVRTLERYAVDDYHDDARAMGFVCGLHSCLYLKLNTFSKPFSKFGCTSLDIKVKNGPNEQLGSSLPRSIPTSSTAGGGCERSQIGGFAPLPIGSISPSNNIIRR
jgi:hypothetical protein